MDTFYISHGSPTLLIEEDLPAAGFLRSWQHKVLVQKPRAILVISGHWETDVPTVSGVHGINDTIYDFYGFPKSMYQYKYPAPGAPDLAKRVKELLVDGGFTKSVKLDTKRGLDHGAWVPLIKMYPECDIPVCQLSVQTNKDGRYHYNMGKALSSLKNEGVLIMGSGATTHNLRAISHDGRGPATWATDFDTWLKDALLSGRFEDVNDFYRLAPSAKLAHPWPDHFYPLHVAMGAAGDGAGAELVHHSWSHGSLSYASYRFSSSN